MIRGQRATITDMDRTVTPIRDAETLRAMAHPLRAQLFYELFARGTARAADLARDLEVPANQVSFHLRQMAKYGLIEEAPEHARDRRDRVWRPASEQGFDIAPDLTSTRGYREAGRRHAHHVLDEYLSRGSKGVYRSHDVSMWLTDAEAEQMANEVAELLMKWTERGQHKSKQSTRRKTYLTMLYVQPLPKK
jgi:DNA-binding transcriptional ArsR family regulator